MTDITHEALEALNLRSLEAQQTYRACSGLSALATMIDAHNAFGSALIDLYRTGQLILAQPSGDDVEAVARKLAPFMEGGREYDQMPATRRELKIWSRNGMALINDATQDDAQEAATAAITALDAHRGKQACLKDRENSDG